MKVLEEQEKVTLLEEERTNLRRRTKTTVEHKKKSDRADNIHKDEIRTKKKLTNLEILLDDNERLQMKVLEEQEKVTLLEEERTNLRRKLAEKEKIIQITEEAKDAFRSRLDEAENNLAKKEEDFKLIIIRFEDMCKYERQMARANQMLDDQLIQLTHQIQKERLHKGNFKQLCLQTVDSICHPKSGN